ncbi:deoxyribodipyrimidine photo-lyase [Edaphobacter sp. 12200R-103]|uniref:deoxyribodipyrimidine photo-lyase n=1 Tax=Edaphobacter sp. 12200R-103 TaxID=2703788 RepID=UPI00138B8AF4|nr:deoxyribodipyrimidine photo-lyase [Edaphobacter sp. 12200R-103]QHS52793.1 deoxyribodipyrimidine photolyase [Edaphobacter sp. 12200R-103]
MGRSRGEAREDREIEGGSAELNALTDDTRVTVRRPGKPDPNGRCVVYWMQRAQRGRDNHAVDVAVKAANVLGLPLVTYFAAISNFPHANLRHYAFLQQGLKDIEEDLAERGIAFVMRRSPHESHEHLFADVGAAMVIGDENPLREPERWRRELASRLRIPFWTVDADVVVPSKLMERAQYGAYTMRPRLYRLLPDYLQPYENLKAEHEWKRPRGFHGDVLDEDITRGWRDLDRSVLPVKAWTGGTHAARRRLHHFVEKILPDYEASRNRPEQDGTSCLSPYLHFGHIGPLTIALAVEAAVKKHPRLHPARDAFFNELIVWRELAVNFVRYTKHYDADECAEPWARKTIAEHARDEREFTYTLSQLEGAKTHDPLWNAAQSQMLHHGWMHNVMRMYWAKKILEWSPDISTAMRHAIHLNDKYFLDGRDPNGYAGLAWAILGKFDRAWNERPVFGKIRYMSGASTGRKFNSRLYMQQMEILPRQKGFDFAG